MSEQKKMNKTLFIVLLIVCFPAAIIYYIVCNKKPSTNPPKSGYIPMLVSAGIWAANGLYTFFLLIGKVDATSGFMFGLPGIIVGAGLIALVIFGKGKKLYNTIYLVAIIALPVLSLVTGWSGYYLVAVIGSLVGIVGAINEAKYIA